MHGRADAAIIDGQDAARALFAPLLAGASEEELHVAHLDSANRLLDLRRHKGTEPRRVELALRTIISDAFELKSVALILAHNHPSGDPAPTPADLEATRTLMQVARPLGIAIRDHLIFAGERVLSFREQGLL